MVLCCDSFDASFELQPWQNGIQLLSIKSGSFCYCPQCGLHTFHSSPCDRCVCVTSIELPIFRALTIESNSMGKLKMSKTFEHITLFRNACKSETVDFSLFKRVFQFWVFVCVFICLCLYETLSNAFQSQHSFVDQSVSALMIDIKYSLNELWIKNSDLRLNVEIIGIRSPHIWNVTFVYLVPFHHQIECIQ